MRFLSRAASAVNRAFLWGASVVMLAAMAMAVANMVGRPFKLPVQGSFELMGLASALIAAFALGFTQECRSHISVDILFQRFPAPWRRWLEAAGNLACSAFFAVAAWRITRFGLRLWETGEVSETLGIVTYPFAFCVALGFWVLALTLLVQMLEAFRPELGEA